MLFALAVVVVLVAVLIVIVLLRRGGAGRRGDLLGPPRGLSPTTRAAPPRPSTRPVDRGREVGASLDNLPDAVAAEARVLLKHNQKLEAIKLIRETIRCELREAKEWCERQQQRR